MKPRVLTQVAPVYPPEAKRRQAEDTVVLRVLISAGGTVSDVAFLRHAQEDASFDAAAASAVRRWTFSPAQKNGEPVACWFNVAVPFRLKK